MGEEQCVTCGFEGHIAGDPRRPAWCREIERLAALAASKVAAAASPEEHRHTLAVALAQVGIVQDDPQEQYALDFTTTDRLIEELAKRGIRLAAPVPAPAPDAHPEASCQRCGRQNPSWFAPSDLWNAVMDGPNGIVCPSCFEAAARAKGIDATWRFEPRVFGSLTIGGRLAAPAPDDAAPEPTRLAKALDAARDAAHLAWLREGDRLARALWGLGYESFMPVLRDDVKEPTDDQRRAAAAILAALAGEESDR